MRTVRYAFQMDNIYLEVSRTEYQPQKMRLAKATGKNSSMHFSKDCQISSHRLLALADRESLQNKIARIYKGRFQKRIPVLLCADFA